MADREREQEADARRARDASQDPRGGLQGGLTRHQREQLDRVGGEKSQWQEASAPAADAPPDEDELAGQNLLGRASVRDGGIPGPSDRDPQNGAEEGYAADATGDDRPAPDRAGRSDHDHPDAERGGRGR